MKRATLALAALLLGSYAAFAGLPSSEAERICNAVYRIEGGAATKYPYGIRSITTTNASHARKICLNSIRNNWKRWEKAGKPGYFGDFMANRYCPTAADAAGNKNWKTNFRRIVGNIKEQQ